MLSGEKPMLRDTPFPPSLFDPLKEVNCICLEGCEETLSCHKNPINHDEGWQEYNFSNHQLLEVSS